MIVDERLTTYIDSLNWQIPEYLKNVEKEAMKEGDVVLLQNTRFRGKEETKKFLENLGFVAGGAVTVMV